MSIVLLLLLFFFLILVGIPIAYSFGVTSILYLFLTEPSNSIILISRSFGAIDSFALMSIPFFILAGDIMKEGEISRNLINFVNIFVGKIKAGFAHITVIASALFGAISGSSAATVAAIGGIMIPEMVKRGYSHSFAVAVTSSSGILGILIPPSIPLIIYGLNANVSVSKLFLASLVPGILMTIGFVITNQFMYKRYCNELTDTQVKKVAEQSQKRLAFRAIPALIMPIIILGGIYGGYFTPTESGAVAVIYGIIISMVFYRNLSFKKLFKISGESAVTSTVILFIIGLSGVFGWLITTQRVPSLIAEWVTSITENPIIVLILINLFYLVLGTFMETVTAIVITTPIFLPLIKMLGIDLVHFGIIQSTNLAIGLMTPPMALNLLLASRIAQIPITKSIKPLIPYLVVSLIILILITYIPQLTLFLPNLLLD